MNTDPLERIVEGVRSVFGRITPVEREDDVGIPEAVQLDIIEHMEQSLPFEGVGLLATGTMSIRPIAQRFYPGRNIDSSPRRYTMDPVEVLAALSDMEQRKLRLLAIVHSHPDTPAVPSASDLAEATVPGVLSLIVRMKPIVDIRAWKFLFRQGVAVHSQEVRLRNVFSVTRVAGPRNSELTAHHE